MTDRVQVERRRLLIGATATLGAAGMVGAAVPFVRALNPGARARAASGPVRADISHLDIGQRAVFSWRGRPVWVVRRSPAMLAGLHRLDSQLRDPDSREVLQQPSYARNPWRSIKPEYLVLTGICTHLGCTPMYRPEVAPADLGADWPGGFFCPCHGSRFDLAGRVFQGVPAPLNLVVPPHRYEGDALIVIGVDQDAA